MKYPKPTKKDFLKEKEIADSALWEKANEKVREKYWRKHGGGRTCSHLCPVYTYTDNGYPTWNKYIDGGYWVCSMNERMAHCQDSSYCPVDCSNYEKLNKKQMVERNKDLKQGAEKTKDEMLKKERDEREKIAKSRKINERRISNQAM